MYSPLRIALVTEGKTDLIVLEAAIKNLLSGRDFISTHLQPLQDLAITPDIGEGWPGVYRWCRQASANAGGGISSDPLFANQDALIIQLDADVAEVTYTSGHITEQVQDLPCEKPCPPPAATTDALRKVLLRWVGEPQTPPRTIFCIPSKSLETWVLVALYPHHNAVRSDALECQVNPERILAGQSSRNRLVRSHGRGYKKITERYEDNAKKFEKAWQNVRRRCSEAEKFSTAFTAFIT